VTVHQLTRPETATDYEINKEHVYKKITHILTFLHLLVHMHTYSTAFKSQNNDRESNSYKDGG